MLLTQTEGNIIVQQSLYLSTNEELTSWKGVAGNLGMYGMGIPAGLLIDRRGPKYGVAMGALALGFGYFPLHSGT